MARGGGAQTRNASSCDNDSGNNNRFSALDQATRYDDPRSPYYLSHIDHPSAMLVAKVLTGSENYGSWKRSMMVALAARNKMKFVDGRLPKPDEEDEDHESWCRFNNFIISWILKVVSSEIGDNIMYHDNASTIWSELQERFN
ncbi:uncharacterized protein LOC133030019 [Cannabis sativa]|uniref:uncharacterized protein LOC133030019 n=1 Tax=Cannabis sativa TaxID=3483 RepID=UPI0029CA14C1|nr:uncharacterized protein LOC133030019 [Cannabis sativa]